MRNIWTQIVDKIKTHILCLISPPQKNTCCLWNNRKKYCIVVSTYTSDTSVVSAGW